ncbi:HlyD family secretion protein [Paludibacter jiangxiensis]|uniref:Membrane fusion protein, multidrug efflux system n=1 Tax=Paludibacter jiangxiensis TaxID=681398 RepID=A0A170ZK19_9BACT|nr:HlyD family secretion protein [Paludibacter jiangxiensis]GAT62748.1 membrane fusion protein, multidrug efflux system [Paludibacter jiangxiensis]
MAKKTKKLVFNIVVGLLLVGGIVWVFSHFIHLGNVEFTDNAQVQQQIVPVNSRVQGFIKEIRFKEYQPVHKGDTLVLIEDAEFRYRLAQAEADYQNALIGKKAMGTTIQTTQSNIGVTDATIEEAKARLENAEKEQTRYKNLLAQKAVTQQQFDDINTNYRAAKARFDQLLRQRNSTSLVKSEQNIRLNQNDAAIKLAKAAFELARLNLSYTVIVAPCDGVTGRKNIQEGQLIQPGQALLDVVNSNEKWVIANYRETQTANIRPSMPVEVKVDAIPGVTFKGVVQTLSRATGSSYSLFPQDNSAGNFVKVEQRIPVRIVFSAQNKPEDLAQLSKGMNVECEVNY